MHRPSDRDVNWMSPVQGKSAPVHSDRDVNWMSPVQGKSAPVQVKEPYGNFDMVSLLVGFHPATWSVQSTPADNTRKRVWRKKALDFGSKGWRFDPNHLR